LFLFFFGPAPNPLANLAEGVAAPLWAKKLRKQTLARLTVPADGLHCVDSLIILLKFLATDLSWRVQSYSCKVAIQRWTWTPACCRPSGVTTMWISGDT